MSSGHNPRPGRRVSDEDLKADVAALIAAGGNRSAAARARGLARITFHDRLKEAEVRFGMVIGKVADGRIEQAEHETRDLPQPGNVARYIFSSVQNNTYLHPGWINLKAYCDWLNGREGDTCEFIVGTYSYALDAYGAKSVKRGSWKPDDGGPWYAPEVVDYIHDSQIEIAPGLVWCGQMNILPTTANPLSGYETYNGRKSNIIPHAKVAMESIPSMPSEGVKFNWATGTITQRNYIQKNAGIKAEAGHSYAGLLVEVTHEGDWFVRQLHIDGNGAVYDVGPSGTHGIRVSGGAVREGANVEAITWGDIHVAEMEDWVRTLGWENGLGGGNRDGASMLDTLHPRYQVMHDIFSMRSRGHHDMKDFHVMYKKMVAGQDDVKAEVEQCAQFLSLSKRKWCETVIVPSNHDRHLERWLKEEDPRKDPKNAKYHMQLQAALLDALDRHEATFNLLQYAVEKAHAPKGLRWLYEDESFVLCKDVDGGIEQGLHGDRGANGSRGSTRGLTRLGRAVTKGHDHTAAIRDGVYSVGACSLEFAYQAGPSSHSVSHVVTFENGRRQMITMWDKKWRA